MKPISLFTNEQKDQDLVLVFYFAQECTCREELAKEAQEQTSLKDLPTLQRLFHQSQIKGNAKLHKGKAYTYIKIAAFVNFCPKSI